VPLFYAGAPLCHREGVEDVGQTLHTVRGEGNGHGGSVNDPTKNELHCTPGAIASFELFEGDGFTPLRTIVVQQGVKDIVDGMKEEAPYKALIVEARISGRQPLHCRDEVVNVHVGVCQQGGRCWKRRVLRDVVNDHAIERAGIRGGNSIRKVVQVMRQRWCKATEVHVDEVGDSFHGGGENRRAVFPPHG
jgi:hypothetical protein